MLALVALFLAATGIASGDAASTTRSWRAQVVVTPHGRPAAAAQAVREAGGVVQLSSSGVVQALVPASALDDLASDSAVTHVSSPTVASPDAVVSSGVARVGADALHAAGLRGAGVRIAVLDPAFGPTSKLDALAGSELPPLERQQRRSFDETYGLPGRDYKGDPSHHGLLVAEVLYDVAPAASYTFVNYHTWLEFGRAVDYLIGTLRPHMIVHANSFLVGPFDGRGWFARQVDRAAAAGILWVNSSGNYRRRHWEGAWVDANHDGGLDAPGHGDAFPLVLPAGSRPACDVSWADASASGTSFYTLGLFSDPAGQRPAHDARSGQPLVSSFVAEPDPHSDLPPGFISAGATYYLRVSRSGNPSTRHLTLFCRVDLPEGAALAPSSVPTPGDARGAFSVGAFDAATLALQAYSSEGPTDDGRQKPDISAPTNAAFSGGPCTGTSCATPHVAGAAALLWAQTQARGGGSVAGRVAARLRSLALDIGAPGPDMRTGAGRVRVDTAPPALGATAPAAGASVRGVVSLRLPIVEAGTLDDVALTLDGSPLAGAVGADRVVRATFDSRALRDGRHVVALFAADRSGNSARLELPLLVDNTAPALGRTHPAAGAAVSGEVRLRLPIVEAGPLTSVSLRVDGAPLPFTLRDRVLQATLDSRRLADGPHAVTIAATDRAGNAASLVLPLLVDNTAPSLVVRASRNTLAGARYEVRVAAEDRLSGVAGPPRVSFGDGARALGETTAHRYGRSGVRRLVVTVHDRAGNVARLRRAVRVVELRLRSLPAGRSVRVEVGRRNRVRIAVWSRGRAIATFTRRLRRGAHVVPLRRLAAGRYRVVARARGYRTATTLRVP